MKVTTKVLHLEGLQKGLSDAADKMPETFVEALYRAAYMVEVPAARKVTEYFSHPTGNLSSSIHSEVMKEELTARVGTNLEYAALREFGGVVEGAWGRAVAVHIGRPYLIPSFQEAIPGIERVFAELMDEMTKEIVTRTRAS